LSFPQRSSLSSVFFERGGKDAPCRSLARAIRVIQKLRGFRASSLGGRAFHVRVVAELLDRRGQTLLDFFRREVVFDVVVFFCGVVRTKEHGAPHREVDRNDQQSHANDSETHVHDTIVGFNGIFGEEQGDADGGTGVTTRADEARGDSQRASRNVRDDTVGGTFRRLHADGEQDHHRNGGAQTVFRQGHEDAHDTLDGLPEPQAPQSSSHAELCAKPSQT